MSFTCKERFFKLPCSFPMENVHQAKVLLPPKVLRVCKHTSFSLVSFPQPCDWQQASFVLFLWVGETEVQKITDSLSESEPPPKKINPGASQSLIFLDSNSSNKWFILVETQLKKKKVSPAMEIHPYVFGNQEGDLQKPWAGLPLRMLRHHPVWTSLLFDVCGSQRNEQKYKQTKPHNIPSFLRSNRLNPQ